MKVTLRNAVQLDCDAIGGLVTQLGYPSSPTQVRERLARLTGDPEHLVLVAEGDGKVIGVLHARLRPTLLANEAVEIMSFVVDEQHRGQSIGATMLDHVDQWVVSLGCTRLRVASNVLRSGAHRFYESHGFVKVKQSVLLEKDLSAEAPRL